ncbi:bifunctional helix-turn-helix transcriptional regulator/GNAT family N-acetyltransferase [Caulobacter mirabilis]|uniref:MarR family transcriptional regulator n=1 Tax=Caulobacter mirabilis TaxID=69666 RepID=A0A2D2AVS6_9CAUL|nr:bifunctional helix-turn-helix transcriptional regulator/GNAT family N-acetyltransferase [Caulobacter mirabilis]ATQ42108.1 MarR family transcriptional regulator [Caulobacter mirabilis]
MSQPTPDQIARLRAFNRRYSKALGLLDEGYHGSDLSVAESRTLYELAQGAARSAADLQRELGFDRGHASRLLGRLERRGLVERSPSTEDGRRRDLALTEAGRAAFATLDAASESIAGGLLAALPAVDRQTAMAALGDVERLFGDAAPAPGEIVLRDPRPGDMGWVVERNAVLYAREQNWNADIEAVCAEIVATFLREPDPSRQRCWIAERDGRRLGCVFVVRDSDETARLRLLIVEPEARGTGLGGRLIAETIAFARAAGYREMVLWTHAVLEPARRLYAKAGFDLVESHEYEAFGGTEVSETWRMDL